MPRRTPARHLTRSGDVLAGLTRRQFQCLFEDTRTATYRFLRYLCRDEGDAEDLLQETYLTVWRKRARYPRPARVQGYLRTIAYRLFLNHCEKHARRRRILEEGRLQMPVVQPLVPSTATRAQQADQHGALVARVHELLALLPPRAREAFVMHRFCGLSTAEIAEVMGAPHKTIEGRLRSATRRLALGLRIVHEDLRTR